MSAYPADVPSPSARPAELLYQVYPELLSSHPREWWQGMGFTGLITNLTVTDAPLDEASLRSSLAGVRDAAGLPFYLELASTQPGSPQARTFWAWRLGASSWASYCANIRLLARVGREYGLCGLMWDCEYYNPTPAQSTWQDPRYAWHCAPRSRPYVAQRARELVAAATEGGEGQLTLSLDAIWFLEARRTAFPLFVRAFGRAAARDCFEVFDGWNARGSQRYWDGKLRPYGMPARLSFYLRAQDSPERYAAIVRERMLSGRGIRIFPGPEFLAGAEFYVAHPERADPDRALYRSLTQ